MTRRHRAPAGGCRAERNPGPRKPQIRNVQIRNLAVLEINKERRQVYLNKVQQMVSGEWYRGVSPDAVCQTRFTPFPQEAPKQCPANGVWRMLGGCVSRDRLLDTGKKHMEKAQTHTETQTQTQTQTQTRTRTHARTHAHTHTHI